MISYQHRITSDGTKGNVHSCLCEFSATTLRWGGVGSGRVGWGGVWGVGWEWSGGVWWGGVGWGGVGSGPPSPGFKILIENI